MVRGAIHWLRNRGVSRHLIAELFDKTPGAISVDVHDENLYRRKLARSVIPPPIANLSLAQDELLLDPIDSRTEAKREQVENAGVAFWRRVRRLEGIRQYGEILQKMSKPGDEDFRTQRLQAHVRQMVAETYVHAGYTQTATPLIERVVSDYHTIYKRTESKVDLASYAKALLVLSRARIQSELWESARSNLELAEAAFSVAHVPIDPEVYRQRAEVCLVEGLDEDANALYFRAFDSFLAHREHLGFGGSAHARFDAGKRPLAVISADFEAALEALEAAEAWPEGDIHRAINLNAAIATAQLSDSSEAKNFPNQYLEKAAAASEGFGQQMTRAMLLGLTPRIPTDVCKAWIRFVLRYNAYRNR